MGISAGSRPNHQTRQLWLPEPPLSVFGKPAVADFFVLPFPGIASTVFGNLQLLGEGDSPNELAVVRHRGLVPSTSMTDIIPIDGDSGGALIDIVDPILMKGDIIGILESGFSSQGAFPNGAPKPDISDFSAASGLRNFALNYNSPSIKLPGPATRDISSAKARCARMPRYLAHALVTPPRHALRKSVAARLAFFATPSPLW